MPGIGVNEEGYQPTLRSISSPGGKRPRGRSGQKVTVARTPSTLPGSRTSDLAVNGFCPVAGR